MKGMTGQRLGQFAAWLGLTTLALVFYAPAEEGRFMAEFYSWLGKYEAQGWSGIWSCFGDPSFHFIHHLFAFLCYQVLGLNTTAWMLLMLALHAANAMNVRALFGELSPGRGRLGWFVALGFLIFPYQTEVVNWGAATHYLLVTGLGIYALRKWLAYARTGSQKPLLHGHLLMLLAMFSLEIALALPVMGLAIVLAHSRGIGNGLRVLLPGLGIVAVYFAANKLLIGDAIGHYGAATHLNLSPVVLGSGFLLYVLKFLLLARYMPVLNEPGFSEQLATTIPGVFGAALALVILALALFRKARGQQIPLWLLASVLFLLALGPILNLYTVSLYEIRSDRLGYFATPFFLLLVAAALTKVRAPFRGAMGAVLLLVYGLFLWPTVQSWVPNGRMIQGSIANWPGEAGQEVYVLGLPDNYRGLYVWRFGFPEAVQLHHPQAQEPQILAWYPMVTPRDSLKAEWRDSLTLTVRIGQWGQWIMGREGMGAKDKGNENWKLVVHEDGLGYDLRFVQVPPPNTRFLIGTGAGWSGVPLPPRSTKAAYK